MPDDWDPAECSLKIGAVEALAMDEFDSDPQDPLTHIETSQGVTGYNESYQKPKWSVKLKVTNAALNTLEGYKANKERVVIVYDCPAFTVTITGARISVITAGGGVKEAPQVTVDGLGLTHERVWKTS
jgi:hypothetical protein